MYAVIKTGGKQYRVAVGEKVRVEKIDSEIGSTVTITDVLAIGEGATLKTASGLGPVTAEVVGHDRDDTVLVFKKKRRHNYRRKNGHRQHHTMLKITKIG